MAGAVELEMRYWKCVCLMSLGVQLCGCGRYYLFFYPVFFSFLQPPGK